MGDIYQAPLVCVDCHLDTGSNYDTYPTRPTVVEHYKSGDEVQAATAAASDVLSCKECHNKAEMIQANADPEDGSFDADGDGIFGGQQNYYHYGKPRLDLRVLAGTATDCDYCHQDPGTAFASAMDVDAAYHSDMPDHSDRPTGPECFDCHGTGRLHDSQITKPPTMYDVAFCAQDCHVDAGVFGSTPEPHATIGPNGNALVCTDCHTDPSATTEKQVHGIRYVSDTGGYTADSDESNAGDCTTCHQGTTVSDVNGNTPPKIPVDFAHSQKDNAGTIWNQTTPGYFGPWQPSENHINACMYCHGNVETVIHTSNGLGRVEAAYDGVSSNINTGIGFTKWCASCHYPPSGQIYDDMMAGFDAAGLERPPDNTAVGLDHSGLLASDNWDRRCAASYCHGALLSAGLSSFMDEYSHNVYAP
jgi:hypothetical protein